MRDLFSPTDVFELVCPSCTTHFWQIKSNHGREGDSVMKAKHTIPYTVQKEGSAIVHGAIRNKYSKPFLKVYRTRTKSRNNQSVQSLFIMMRQFLTLFALVAMMVGTDAFVSQNNAFVATTQKSSSSLQMTVLTYGNKKKDFKPGSKLSAACSALGVKPRYNCKK